VSDVEIELQGRLSFAEYQRAMQRLDIPLADAQLRCEEHAALFPCHFQSVRKSRVICQDRLGTNTEQTEPHCEEEVITLSVCVRREVFDLVDEDQDGFIEWPEFAKEIHRHVRHHEVHHRASATLPPEPEPEPEPRSKLEPEPEPQPQLEPQLQPQPQPQSEPEPKPEPEPEPEPQLEPRQEPRSQPPLQLQPQPRSKLPPAPEPAPRLPTSLHASIRHRDGDWYQPHSWAALLQDAARCGISIPTALQPCEENWSWLVAAVDGAECRCALAEREGRPRHMRGENTLWDGLRMSRSQDLRSW
jgi:hypothetical protein